MGVSYQEFKDYHLRREYDDYEDLKELLQKLEGVVEEKDIKCFYPKNVYNNKAMELIFFFENSVMTAKYLDNKSELGIIKDKLKYVNMTMHHYSRDGYELRLDYGNGKEIVLHSKEDTNQHHILSYGQTILEIYKYLLKKD